MTELRPAGPFGINVENVSKSFDTGLVLDGIDLTIQPGSFAILVGPSGCGKTTLLRLMGGLDAPSDGRLELQGENRHFPSQMSEGIGYCFQEPRLLPWRTVIDNVVLPLELQGVSSDERVSLARETLHLVGLENDAAKLPHQLSGGMQMRVSIARAMVTRPRLLLLDEPFAALDEISRVRMDDELLKLWHETGVTVVMVTHSLTEAIYLGQEVHFMAASPGRITESLKVELDPRSPAIRSTPAFAEWVALAHGMLAVCEGSQL